jgi:hypothetical protein
MTPARHLHLVPTEAQIIPLDSTATGREPKPPRRRVAARRHTADHRAVPDRGSNTPTGGDAA